MTTLGATLVTGSDFNNADIGQYILAGAASDYTNAPSWTGNGARMTVIPTNATNRPMQILMSRAAETFIRNKTSATGWNAWQRIVTNTELAAVQAQLVSNVTNTSTFTIYDAGFDALGTAPKIIFLAANAAQANAMSIYGVRTTGNGTLYRTIIFEGTGSSAPRIGTNGEIRLNSTTTPTPVYAWVMNSTPSTPVN